MDQILQEAEGPGPTICKGQRIIHIVNFGPTRIVGPGLTGIVGHYISANGN